MPGNLILIAQLGFSMDNQPRLGANGPDRTSTKLADAALRRLEVDGRGLDQMDRRYLTMIAEHYGGGPVGAETIAAALSEPRDAIEEIIEPYLIQQGFVNRTPRGRILTPRAFDHLGLATPRSLATNQSELFSDGPDEG